MKYKIPQLIPYVGEEELENLEKVIEKKWLTEGPFSKEFAEFPCPQCGEKIVRCNYCRENRVKYKCSCEFAGP